MVYDTDSGLWGERGISKSGPNEPEYPHWVIHDFKNEIFYFIDSKRNICQKQPNNPDQGNCLPGEYFCVVKTLEDKLLPFGFL